MFYGTRQSSEKESTSEAGSTNADAAIDFPEVKSKVGIFCYILFGNPL